MKWWKRFAFFDRDNYSLPPAVRDDIFSPQLLWSHSDSEDEKINAKRQNDDDDLDFKTTTMSTTEDRTRPKGDMISLAIVNGAGVPLASVQPSADPTHGVNGMIRTLAACSKYGRSLISEEKALTMENQMSNPSTVRDNATSDSLDKDMFWFSSTGQTLSIPKAAQRSGNIDGSLVLAFLSSRATSRVHCIDLTVRCNPIQMDGDKSLYSTNSAGSGGKNAPLVSSSRASSAGSDNDFDGWRGYFEPFAHDHVGNTNSHDNNNSNNNNTVEADQEKNAGSTDNGISGRHSKVIHVAVCSDHETDVITLGKNIYVACVTDAKQSVGVTVHRNPHLYLNDSDALKESSKGSLSNYNPKVTPKVECFQPQDAFDHKSRGRPVCVDVKTGFVAVGTDTGMVILYQFHPVNSAGSSNAQGNLGGCNGTNKLTVLMELSPPRVSSVDPKKEKGGDERVNDHKDESGMSMACVVTSLKLVLKKVDGSDNSAGNGAKNNSYKHAKIFVTYSRSQGADENFKHTQPSSKVTMKYSTVGVCCYDLGVIGTGVGVANTQLAPKNRYDLDGRGLVSSCLSDIIMSRSDIHGTDVKEGGEKFMIARSDGLYTYSSTEKISVSPIDGTKIALCSLPRPPTTKRRYSPQHIRDNALLMKDNDKEEGTKIESDSMQDAGLVESGASYVLIATTDQKSGRDAVDIYDTQNKLVAFHLLLSPGHRALRTVSIATTSRLVMDGKKRGGLSTAVVVTSGGSVVLLTEKVTSDKVSLLVQKNLYSAAISMAFADPTYLPSDITSLFRKHAEHLYRKGDYPASMDQYIFTIGSLEPSHVIYRFLDAPKIPLLTKYLEELHSRKIATSVHIELLRTCYLKLNDVAMAEKLSASLSKSMDSKNCVSLVSDLLHSPTEALATICSFDAPQAVEALKSHGPTLAKAMPRETAGLVLSLCDGVYTPASFIGSNGNKRDLLKESLESNGHSQTCELYPVHLFSSAFLESPKLLRVILSHCYHNRRELTPPLRRMLLELTLEEWNAARKSKDLDNESVRREEAIAMLSDPNASKELGDYETLVIVEQHDFVEGIVMLYEKLQMIPLLLEKYAQDGSYKARRQMLAMCRGDPELLADVLGYFVSMANEKVNAGNENDSVQSDGYIGELMDDIKEALTMARSLKTLPPVRVARILSGDSVGQFTEERRGPPKHDGKGVPLSVALDYVGSVMDEQYREVERLKSMIEEYNKMCNTMENQINELIDPEKNVRSNHLNEINIDEMFAKLMDAPQDNTTENKSELVSEEFWRQMEQTSDRFDTIVRFFSKDILE